jgi:hypothetical protein
LLLLLLSHQEDDSRVSGRDALPTKKKRRSHHMLRRTGRWLSGAPTNRF